MNKSELISAVAEKAEVSKKDTEAVINAVMEVIKEEVAAGSDVQIIGFGTFTVAERAEREGRNPQTGEVMKIAASKSPKFKAGKAFNIPDAMPFGFIGFVDSGCDVLGAYLISVYLEDVMDRCCGSRFDGSRFISFYRFCRGGSFLSVYRFGSLSNLCRS